MSAETFDLIVKGGEVVNHAGRGVADGGIRDGRIVTVGDRGRHLVGVLAPSRATRRWTRS